jgi:hypothetical protein
VVYEEEPGRAKELLARVGGAHTEMPTGDGRPPVAGRVSAIWAVTWRWAAGTFDGPDGAVLFLHERRSGDDKRLLVCVQADRAGRRLRVTFIHPGSTRLDPIAVRDVAVVPRPQEGLIMLGPGVDPFAAKLPPADAGPDARADLRFFAGQPDQSDSTAFTIGYESAGRAGEIAMWVQDERTVYYVNRLFAAK